MTEDHATASNSGSVSSPLLATVVETWANLGDLAELDALLKEYIEREERLTDRSVPADVRDAIAWGMKAFQLLHNLDLRWRDETDAERLSLEWDNVRGICARYQRWFGSSQRVLRQNRRIKGTSAAIAAETLRLHEACLLAMAPANVNVNDLKDAHERLEGYNKSHKAMESRSITAGGGA